MGKKLFISHSTVDHVMIDILLEFLNNIGINNEDIFCTSINNIIESGELFIEKIKENVKDCEVVVFLLTERFFLSSFCLAELGAAWALNQNILPIIVPPISTAVEYNNTPLMGVQALNMGSRDFAEQFFNELFNKGLIKNDEADNEVIFNDFNIKIKKELRILRPDSNGFYIARLLNNQVVQKELPFHEFTQYFVSPEKENLWRLNGLLDIDNDPKITEHWINVSKYKLSTPKLQFKITKELGQIKNKRLFEIDRFTELL